MTKLKILYQSDDYSKMFLDTNAGQCKAYALAKECVHDNTGKNIQFYELDHTDTTPWIDGKTDPAAIRRISDLWNGEIRKNYDTAFERIKSIDNDNSPAWHELAVAVCEMANIVIYGCKHLVFIKDEYGCCVMQTMLTENDICAIYNHPDKFCFLTLEYY